jgi:hypothetical protein
LKLTQIKEQMGSLERVLEQDVARRATAAAGAEVPMPEDEKDLEPSPLATVDAFFAMKASSSISVSHSGD